jgi:hypothetical protein
MKYSENKIFDDSNVNAILDRLYYHVNANCPGINVMESLVLSGAGAAIIQGAAEKPLQNVILVTDNMEVFDYVRNGLSKALAAKGAMYFQERALLYFQGLYLEVWLSLQPLTVVYSNSISLQHINEIDPDLL